MNIENISYFEYHSESADNGKNKLKIAWREAGIGEPVLLIHGFASNGYVNWIATGWSDFLLRNGYRVILIDNRGHGNSDKLYDISAYTPSLMVEDSLALLKHLKISSAHIMGYSMGARIAALLASTYPQLVKTLVLGGLGINMVTGTGDWRPVVDALLAPSLDTIQDKNARMFRVFAEKTRSDLRALAACVIKSKQELTTQEVNKIIAPTLVVVGSNDEIGGDPKRLAQLIPGSEAVSLLGRDHMLAVGDKQYKQKVLEFFKKNP